MTLSDKQILDQVKKGNIIIEPFRKENLSLSSYDVCLGDFYYREKEVLSRYGASIPYNIYSEADTKRVWGKVEEAKSYKEFLQREPELEKLMNHEGIKLENRIILLEPGETILAHTVEFIGAKATSGKSNILTDMKCRSSIGRSFIGVCKCAGLGNIGYYNRWTMEVTNFALHHTVILVTGRRVAQIVFIKTGELLDKGYSSTGKYQTGDNIADLKKSWKPEMMLPQLYKDRDINS